MYLTAQGKKVLILEQSEYVGGAWGKVPLNEDWPDFQLGCHIWDIEPKAFEFLAQFLDMEFTPLVPQPKFVFKGMKLAYDYKNLIFYVGSLLGRKGEKASFKKARIIPAKYIYPSGGSLQFIDRLLNKVDEFGIEIKTGVKVDQISIDDKASISTSQLNLTSDEVVLTSVSQLNNIESKEAGKMELPLPRLVDYIHCHLIVKDSSKAKFSYVRLPESKLIHRVSDETNHIVDHGIEMNGHKLILAGVLPHRYEKNKEADLANALIEELKKLKFISNDAVLESHHWNVFPTHYIPHDERPKIVERFKPYVRLMHTTNLIFGIRDNVDRWKILAQKKAPESAF